MRLAVRFTQLCCFGANVTAGFIMWKHDRGASLFNFGAALFIAYITISCEIRSRKFEEAIHHARNRMATELMATELNAMYSDEVIAKANRRLEQVAKAVGAEIATNGCWEARLRIKKTTFTIFPTQITRTNLFSTRSTCLRHRIEMPPAEKMAATLLLLKNDPSIFVKWCKQDEFYA